ncbi:MAG: DUF3007 family protein [Gloeomargaritaceae cyanobacterium C42_A2020_066]|nr:DUF3007 family protein [Gloeomargaritaceae cyanobacterium C42_A2020_066]
MRRLDVLLFGLLWLGGGAALYGVLCGFGVDGLRAGLWTQAALVVGVVGWLATYSLRVVRKDMTYHHQRGAYEQAWLEQQWDKLSPEEQARLLAEVEAEKQHSDTKDT